MRLRKVILITIDSLRADCSAPLMASIQKRLGKVINRIIFANGPGTPQSFPAILASSSFLLLNPDFTVPEYMITLPEILSKHNFITVGIHSNPYLSHAFGWHKGFKIFYDHFDEISTPTFSIVKSKTLRRILSMLMKSRRIGTKILPRLRKFYQLLIALRASKPPYIDAKDITDTALNVLNSYRYSKLFLWVHYMDTHWPYNIPDDKLANECKFDTSKQALKFLYKIPISFTVTEERTLSIDKHTLEKMICLYRMSVTYVCKNVEKLLVSLKELDLLDESLIILTGDHGEAFLEHGELGHPFHTLYNENLLVPLIIWHPYLQGLNSGNVTPIQLREIPAFILNALNIKMPIPWAKTTLSKHLIFAESAYVHPADMLIDKNKYIIAVTDKKYKLILDKIKERVELYDLEKDPSERNNIVNHNEDIANDLLRSIEKYRLTLSIPYKIHHKIYQRTS